MGLQDLSLNHFDEEPGKISRVSIIPVDLLDSQPREFETPNPTITVFYGINAVGKDRLAAELQKNWKSPGAVITSESRLLMYGLGIVDSPDATLKVENDAYKRLEETTQPEIAEIEARMGGILKGIKEEGTSVIYLSHLIFALHLKDDQVEYLTEKPIHSWINSTVDRAIHLKAPAEEIFRRRIEAGVLTGRKRPVDLDQIVYHQRLCDERWAEFVATNTSVRCAEVTNDRGTETQTVNAIADFLVTNQI